MSGFTPRAQSSLSVSLSLDRSTVRAGELIRLVGRVNAIDGTMTFVDVTSGIVLGSQTVDASGSAIRLVLVNAQRWTAGLHEIEARYTGSAGPATSMRRSITVQLLKGSVAAWGIGSSGQIGNGAFDVINALPVRNILSDAVAVTYGWGHTVALKSNGTVWTWGNGQYGQLGRGPNVTSTNVPGQILTDANGNPFTGIVTIAAGEYHTLAVKYDNGAYTVWAWGLNDSGQLGDGTISDHFAPVQVLTPIGGAISGVVSVAAGSSHSLALAWDGSVYSWGSRNYGQLGDDSFDMSSPAAQRIAAFAPGSVTRVAAGGLHSLALKDDGSVYSWGYNAYGQLGVGHSNALATPAIATMVPASAREIAAGFLHSAAINADGTVYTWGNNFEGELGNGSAGAPDVTAGASRMRIVFGSPLTGVTQISCGYFHTLALKGDGTLWVSGYDEYGAIGNGSSGDISPLAVQTSSIAPFAILGTGSSGYHSTAIEAPTVTDSQLTLAPASSTYGTPAQLSATLSSNGAPLPQKTLHFSIDGIEIGAATTNDNGVATLAAGPNVSAGSHSVHASFAGDDAFASSESDSSLSVALATPVVTIIGGTFTYDGQPHAATVSAKVGIADVGPVVVTYNGSAIAPVDPGTYTVLASYAGDANHQAGSASGRIEIIAPLPVNHPPTALCQNVTVVAGADGTASASIDRGSFDADGETLKRLQTPAGPYGIGGTRVRLSVTDTHGASSFCDGTVTVLRYGLRAAYGFEETPGTSVALDATPFHNNGSVNGPARIEGRFGQGMRFDGVDDIINVADSDSLDLTRSMTLMAWVRPDADSGWRTILMKERQNGLAYALYANDSIGDGTPAGYVRLGFADREIAAPDAPATGQWMHVAMTFGGGQIRIYVNGMLARSDYAYGSAPVSDRALRMGGNTVWSDEFFKGVLDEVRVYDRALSDLEIRDDMQSPVVFGSAPPQTSSTGLVAAYSFDDGTARDVSGHGHDGAVRGPVAAAGRQGQALSFDGIDDLVMIARKPDLDFRSGMTLEAWVYPKALGTSWRTVVLKLGTSSLTYGLYANDDVSRPAGYTRTDNVDRGSSSLAGGLPLNVWTHLVATYDEAAGLLSVWANGAKVGQSSVSGDIEVSDGALFIGGNTLWGEYFAGLIDGVRLYNRPLNVVEIQTNRITPVSP